MQQIQFCFRFDFVFNLSVFLILIPRGEFAIKVNFGSRLALVSHTDMQAILNRCLNEYGARRHLYIDF